MIHLTDNTLLRTDAIRAEYNAGAKAAYNMALHEVRGEQILYRRSPAGIRGPFNPLADVATAVQLLIDVRGDNIAISVTVDDDGMSLFYEPPGMRNPSYSSSHPTVQAAIVYGIIELL